MNKRFAKFAHLFAAIMFVSMGINANGFTPILLSVFMFITGIVLTWLYIRLVESDNG